MSPAKPAARPLPPEPPRRDRRFMATRQDDRILCLPLETVTPIFGGAASPRQLDDVDAIRVSGIRGQLRFFWRALYGHECQNAAELAAQEFALWGGITAQQPVRSRVDLWLSHVSGIGPGSRDTSRIKDRRVGYVLWPARPPREEAPWAPRRKKGVQFCLHVRIADPDRKAGNGSEITNATQVLSALRAWLLFGGIGSRTRRGCGSLTINLTACAGQPDRIQLAAWLPAEANPMAIERLLGMRCISKPARPLRDMPSLHGARLFHGRPGRSPKKAWEQAISWLQQFRMEIGPKQRGKPKRELNHARAIQERAALGLPIVGLAGNENARLGWNNRAGQSRDRLTSPVIFKPLPLADGRFAPIALWLARADPKGSLIWLCGDSPQGLVAGEFPKSDRLLGDFKSKFSRLKESTSSGENSRRKGSNKPRNGGNSPRNRRQGGKRRQ
ncbi:MAG: type III-B CRISPR module RAMP protein Cmr1 [Proteobacteria bacterium]|nr:type III-B CRISPR module RAMP protein Cmr1 [Pseudomonadota bacterium]